MTDAEKYDYAMRELPHLIAIRELCAGLEIETPDPINRAFDLMTAWCTIFVCSQLTEEKIQ